MHRNLAKMYFFKNKARYIFGINLWYDLSLGDDTAGNWASVQTALHLAEPYSNIKTILIRINDACHTLYKYINREKKAN